MIERRPASQCSPAPPGGIVDDGDIQEFDNLFGAKTEPDPDARSETDGVEDMRAFIGHTAWKSAPSAHIELDEAADLLTVSCYRDFPDVEIDPSPALSVAFHRYREEYILTSLCLYGVARWSDSLATSTSEADRPVARKLIGQSISGAVENLLGGGSGTVELPAAEAAALLPIWRQFVSANACDRYPSQS